MGPGSDTQINFRPAIPVAVGVGDVQFNVKAGRCGQFLERLSNFGFAFIVLGRQFDLQRQGLAFFGGPLFQQFLGAFGVIGGNVARGLVRMHRRDMGIDRQITLALIGQLRDLFAILAHLQGVAHAHIGPWFQVDTHTTD